MKAYQPISDRINEKAYSKAMDFKARFDMFSTYHQLPNAGNCEVTLEQLSTLLTGDSLLSQFDIIDTKVTSFLNDPQVGFLNVSKLYDDMVIGIIAGEYDADCYDNYQQFVDEAIQSQIVDSKDECANSMSIR